MAELDNSEEYPEEDQQLIVSFEYNRLDLMPLRDLEAKLQRTLERHDVGQGNGHTLAADLSDGSLFFVCADAARLFDVIGPVLREADFMAGAVARLFDGAPGDPGVTELQIPIRI